MDIKAVFLYLTRQFHTVYSHATDTTLVKALVNVLICVLVRKTKQKQNNSNKTEENELQFQYTVHTIP